MNLYANKGHVALFPGISVDYVCPKLSLLLCYDVRGVRSS